MEIPWRWLQEAGVGGFVLTGQSYRCATPHTLISLTEIEPVIRRVPLDENGFDHDRMISLLVAMRIGIALPPVSVERFAHPTYRYRLRDGTHRFYGSLAVGFTHLPTEICEPF